MREIPDGDYPFVSVCGKEFNFIRPAATPIVFHSLMDTEDENGQRDLVYGGTKLKQPFDESTGIAVCEKTGRLYHKLTKHSLDARGTITASRQE